MALGELQDEVTGMPNEAAAVGQLEPPDIGCYFFARNAFASASSGRSVSALAQSATSFS